MVISRLGINSSTFGQEISLASWGETLVDKDGRLVSLQRIGSGFAPGRPIETIRFLTPSIDSPGAMASTLRVGTDLKGWLQADLGGASNWQLNPAFPMYAPNTHEVFMCNGRISNPGSGSITIEHQTLYVNLTTGAWGRTTFGLPTRIETTSQTSTYSVDSGGGYNAGKLYGLAIGPEQAPMAVGQCGIDLFVIDTATHTGHVTFIPLTFSQWTMNSKTVGGFMYCLPYKFGLGTVLKINLAAETAVKTSLGGTFGVNDGYNDSVVIGTKIYAAPMTVGGRYLIVDTAAGTTTFTTLGLPQDTPFGSIHNPGDGYLYCLPSVQGTQTCQPIRWDTTTNTGTKMCKLSGSNTLSTDTFGQGAVVYSNLNFVQMAYNPAIGGTGRDGRVPSQFGGMTDRSAPAAVPLVRASLPTLGLAVQPDQLGLGEPFIMWRTKLWDGGLVLPNLGTAGDIWDLNVEARTDTNNVNPYNTTLDRWDTSGYELQAQFGFRLGSLFNTDHIGGQPDARPWTLMLKFGPGQIGPPLRSSFSRDQSPFAEIDVQYGSNTFNPVYAFMTQSGPSGGPYAFDGSVNQYWWGSMELQANDTSGSGGVGYDYSNTLITNVYDPHHGGGTVYIGTTPHHDTVFPIGPGNQARYYPDVNNDRIRFGGVKTIGTVYAYLGMTFVPGTTWPGWTVGTPWRAIQSLGIFRGEPAPGEIAAWDLLL